MGPPVAFHWGFPCRHFLSAASEWIADGQKKTSWHGERGPVSSALWERIYNRMALYALLRVGLAAAGLWENLAA